jgi:hypothetical protein
VRGRESGDKSPHSNRGKDEDQVDGGDDGAGWDDLWIRGVENRGGADEGSVTERNSGAAGAGCVGSGLTPAAFRSAAAEAEADRREYADDGIGGGEVWAIYNRYTDELRQINDEKYRLVQEYGKQWGEMTDDQALIYIRRWLEVDSEIQALRLKYVPEVIQALPGRKAATFFQLDRRISMMMELQLASQMPVVDGKENGQ